LPNELFLLVFSYLKPDEIIQALCNLNERFQSLVYPFARHPVLYTDAKPNWIKKYMSLIKNDVETIKLSVTHAVTTFLDKNSYPNLRLITIYLTVEWQVELDVENASPFAVIASALKVLSKCSFDRVKPSLLRLFDFDHKTQTTDSIQVSKPTIRVRLSIPIYFRQL
jgi:hypothetical protein